MAIEQQYIVTNKTFIRAVEAVSAIFTSFFIPFVAFLILFLFSYLQIMPLQYKLVVLGMVYCFIVPMPTLTIFFFRKINGFGLGDLAERKRGYILFTLTITSYILRLLTVHRLSISWYMTGIIFVVLIMVIVCIIVNLKWKSNEHTAGADAIIGGLVAFNTLFGHNLADWLCIFALITGVLGTVRIILQHHTLGEIAGGLVIGLICSLLVPHPFYKLVFRLLNISLS